MALIWYISLWIFAFLLNPTLIINIPFEIICYEYLYKIKLNNKLPDDIYRLNYYHNYDITDHQIHFKCHSYNSKIHGHESISIIICGHMFHSLSIM